jgi:GNAT superfamily N-acetyltransferase
LQLNLDQLSQYVAFVRPNLSAEDQGQTVLRLQEKFQSGERKLSHLRIQLNNSGQIRAAITMSSIGDDCHLLSPLIVPKDNEAEKIAAVDLLSEMVTSARESGASRLCARVEFQDLFPQYKQSLVDQGFEEVGGRIEFKSPVELLPGEAGSPLNWVNMDAVGEAHAAELLGLVGRGAPDWEEEDDPAQLLKDYFSSDPHLTAGPDCVHIGRLGKREVALVIAQVDDRDGWSRLTYMGLVPDYQGKGLGSWVHRHGFGMLKAQKGQLYHGGCSMDNKAMWKLFERHGCKECRRLSEWSLRL